MRDPGGLLRWLREKAVRSREVPDTPAPLWTDIQCDVCHRRRPHQLIAVVQSPIPGMEDLYPESHLNIRYCLDDPECQGLAMEKAFPS